MACFELANELRQMPIETIASSIGVSPKNFTAALQASASHHTSATTTAAAQSSTAPCATPAGIGLSASTTPSLPVRSSRWSSVVHPILMFFLNMQILNHLSQLKLRSSQLRP
jgi:hypothetical protein